MESSSDDETPCSNIKDLLGVLSKPLSSISPQNLERGQICVESGNSFLKWKLKQLVAAASDSVDALIFSGDGTPIETKTRAKVSVRDVKVCRSGCGTNVHYVQQAMAIYVDDEGVTHTAMVMSDPVPWLFGKSTPAQLGCAFQFLPTLRELPRIGIAIGVSCYDRAFLSSNGRGHLPHHQEVHNRMEPNPEGSKGCEVAVPLGVALVCRRWAP